jgi:predicted DNA-binding transcriptional regulator AlpA
MANLDSQGRGPKAVKSGRRVAYLREDLVAWLENWLSKKA